MFGYALAIDAFQERLQQQQRNVCIPDAAVQARVLRRLEKAKHPEFTRIRELLLERRTCPGYSAPDRCVGLANLILDLVPERGVFVETGREYGVSAELIARMRPGALLHSVDQNPRHEATQRLERMHNVVMHTSHSLDFAATVGDKTLDFVYVDTGHTYREVLSEVRAWRSKLKSGGVLAGHDYFSHWLSVIAGVTDAMGAVPHYVYSDSSWAYLIP